MRFQIKLLGKQFLRVVHTHNKVIKRQRHHHVKFNLKGCNYLRLTLKESCLTAGTMFVAWPERPRAFIVVLKKLCL